MNKALKIFLIVTLIIVPTLFAQEPPLEEKGGVNPCLASCFIGPRVGLEMNEGKEITTSEWIGFGGTFLGYIVPGASLVTSAYMAYDMGGKTNGMEGFFASFCLGPRIGNEIDQRKVRKKEWMLLVPCVNLYPAISIPLEAYNGKTMSEIEVKENLRKY